MERYAIWTGTYSFVNEIGMFLEMFKEKLNFLIKEIEKTEKAIEKPL